MSVDSSAAGRDVAGHGAAWASCPDCGLAQRVPALAAGSLASCRRCGGTLAVNTGYGIDTVLAVALAALILLLFAYLSPLFPSTPSARPGRAGSPAASRNCGAKASAFSP